MDMEEEILYCDEKYQSLSVTFRAQVTFKEFVSILHPEWNKDDIVAWAKKITINIFWKNKIRKVDTPPHVSGLKGAQIEPMPIQDDDVCIEDGRVVAWDAPSVEIYSEVSTHERHVEELDMERTIP
jgi:hypothetical protein